MVDCNDLNKSIQQLNQKIDTLNREINRLKLNNSNNNNGEVPQNVNSRLFAIESRLFRLETYCASVEQTFQQMKEGSSLLTKFIEMFLP